MTQEILKLALEYIEAVPDDRYNAEHIDRAALITVIEEALAQPEQEPVADDFFRMIADRNPKPFPLPQRTWAGLTDDEIDAIYTGVRAVHREIDSDVFARAIEAKLKEINT